MRFDAQWVFRDQICVNLMLKKAVFLEFGVLNSQGWGVVDSYPLRSLGEFLCECEKLYNGKGQKSLTI